MIIFFFLIYCFISCYKAKPAANLWENDFLPNLSGFDTLGKQTLNKSIIPEPLSLIKYIYNVAHNFNTKVQQGAKATQTVLKNLDPSNESGYPSVNRNEQIPSNYAITHNNQSNTLPFEANETTFSSQKKIDQVSLVETFKNLSLKHNDKIENIRSDSLNTTNQQNLVGNFIGVTPKYVVTKRLGSSNMLSDPNKRPIVELVHAIVERDERDPSKTSILHYNLTNSNTKVNNQMLNLTKKNKPNDKEQSKFFKSNALPQGRLFGFRNFFPDSSSNRGRSTKKRYLAEEHSAPKIDNFSSIPQACLLKNFFFSFYDTFFPTMFLKACIQSCVQLGSSCKRIGYDTQNKICFIDSLLTKVYPKRGFVVIMSDCIKQNAIKQHAASRSFMAVDYAIPSTLRATNLAAHGSLESQVTSSKQISNAVPISKRIKRSMDFEDYWNDYFSSEDNDDGILSKFPEEYSSNEYPVSKDDDTQGITKLENILRHSNSLGDNRKSPLFTLNENNAAIFSKHSSTLIKSRAPSVSEESKMIPSYALSCDFPHNQTPLKFFTHVEDSSKCEKICSVERPCSSFEYNEQSLQCLLYKTLEKCLKKTSSVPEKKSSSTKLTLFSKLPSTEKLISKISVDPTFFHEKVNNATTRIRNTLKKTTTVLAAGNNILEAWNVNQLTKLSLPKVEFPTILGRDVKGGVPLGANKKSSEYIAEPKGVRKPDVTCFREGMRCCVPYESVRRLNFGWPSMGNVDSKECRTNYVPRLNMYCTTILYDKNQCKHMVFRLTNLTMYRTTITLPDRHMNDAVCECIVEKQTSIKKMGGKNNLGITGVAHWLTSQKRKSLEEAYEKRLHNIKSQIEQGSSATFQLSQALAKMFEDDPNIEKLERAENFIKTLLNVGEKAANTTQLLPVMKERMQQMNLLGNKRRFSSNLLRHL